MNDNIKLINASTQPHDLASQGQKQQEPTPHKTMTVFDRLGNTSGDGARAVPIKKIVSLVVVLLAGVVFICLPSDRSMAQDESAIRIQGKKAKLKVFDNQVNANAESMVEVGRQIFRFDTFGDEA